MKILTCNIRTSTADDGENNWEHRRVYCIEVIKAREPDIICFQETKADQFADLKYFFPEFNHYALMDQPAGPNPVNCLFYRSDLYRDITAGGYWLSETPHIPGSKSWDSKCVRLANWIRLENRKTGFEFRVVNTHLDHVSQPARENQAKLIAEDSAAYPASYPQLLTGDMNCDCTNKAIDIFKAWGWSDTYGAVHGNENPGQTHHAFLGRNHTSAVGKMDWIFMRGAFETSDAEVITDSSDGKFPSDHYFVSATIVAAG